MAQIGSFVPAAEFEITPFDAIFTRLSSSSFMQLIWIPGWELLIIYSQGRALSL
jgi:hypothetical protein